MWMKDNKNNNATPGKPDSANYAPPEMPQPIIAYRPDLIDRAFEYRNTFQPERQDFVHVYIRTRRANYEQILYQLLKMGVIKKDHAYSEENLPYWTISIRIKVRTHVPFGRILNVLKDLLGIKSSGLRFCLDGFYGMQGFSDVFNSPDGCPWMEVSNFATASSLRLMDGDNIFINTATISQMAAVIAWRKQKLIGDLHPKSAKPITVTEDTSEMSNVVGNIVYEQYDEVPAN